MREGGVCVWVRMHDAEVQFAVVGVGVRSLEVHKNTSGRAPLFGWLALPL
jgi:hypothetical protein